MGGGPDNVKDACISELTNYALTVARLPEYCAPFAGREVRPQRNQPSHASLAMPAERFQLLLQESQAIAQSFAIAFIAAFFEVGKDPRAMQQQTVTLALRL